MKCEWIIDLADRCLADGVSEHTLTHEQWEDYARRSLKRPEDGSVFDGFEYRGIMFNKPQQEDEKKP